jgi:hypothetical protein
VTKQKEQLLKFLELQLSKTCSGRLKIELPQIPTKEEYWLKQIGGVWT